MPGSRSHVCISPAGATAARARRLIVAVAMTLGLLAPAASAAAPATKVIGYHGYHVLVPANWPVYSLDRDPTVCVRFNRHAVYLGRPGSDQHCATNAAGRTEAILIEPLNSPGVAAAPVLGAPLAGTSLGRLVDRAEGVAVTATWGTDPAVIVRALGHSVSALAAGARVQPEVPPAPALDFGVRATGSAATPGETYTGPAFDACSTPSSSQMAAWGASRYRALGVYIGGTNMACSQANLTSSWVAQQSARGWHLIPIYVGLQAPSNSCGCAPIAPRLAAGEGTAAARDAVAQARAIDLGAGNPIYYDMEAYTRNHRNTTAVMAFLQGWTRTLHAAGYKSGVYSSDYSGIEDLAARVGTAYAEPDEIWVANWNGAETTADPTLPASYWADHQRIHQYRGSHNERHGGVTIDIDSDYVDAATAAAGSGISAPSARPASPARPAAPAPAAAPKPAAAPSRARRGRHTPWWRAHRHHGSRRRRA